MIVFLIGITGVGKSTVGKKIARELSYSFIDLDALIEHRNNMRVSEIFKVSEEDFRLCETKSLKTIPTDEKIIVATGGGIVEKPENIEYMKSVGKVILLERPLHRIIETVNPNYRPLLKGNRSKLYALYKRRKPLYDRACDFMFSTDGYWDNLDGVINFIKEAERESSNNGIIDGCR